MEECYMGYVLYLEVWHQNTILVPPSLPIQHMLEEDTYRGGHEEQETLLIKDEGEVNVDMEDI